MRATSSSSGLTIDWKPILVWGGGTGMVIGSWWGLWLVGFLLAWDRGWLHPGIEIPLKDAVWFRIPVEQSLPWVSELLRVNPPPNLLAAFVWVAFIGAAMGAGIASVGRLLKVDPHLTSLRSFGWSLRAMLTPMAVAINLLAIAAVSAAIWVESATTSSWLGWTVLGLVFVAWFVGWFALVPMVVCQAGLAGSPLPPWWWRPRWPGWKALGIFLGIEIITIALNWLPPDALWEDGDLTRFAVAVVLIFVVLSFAFFVAPLVQCSILMGTESRVLALWRTSFKWETLGPWIALHGWWTGLVLVLAPPCLAVYVWYWKYAPVLATYLEGDGRFFSYSYRLFIDAIHFIGNFWWLLVMVPLMLLFWLGVARFVSLNGPKSGGSVVSDSPATAAKPKTHSSRKHTPHRTTDP